MFLFKSLQPDTVVDDDGSVLGLGQVHQCLLTFPPNIRILIDMGWNRDLTMNLDYLKK